MNGNKTSDPLFKDGGYALTSSSPCVNAGSSQSWMNIATDLAGNDRVYGSTVDMGAYEQQTDAATLFILASVD